MSPDEAAGLLGIPVTAGPEEVARAFRQRARAVHPDAGGSGEDFIRLAQARDALLAHQPLPWRVEPVPPFSWRLWCTWIGLLVLACLLAASGDWLPLTPVEPIVRSVALIGALGAYARTGRRGWLVLALLALAATVAVSLIFATLGTLVGLLIAVAPVYGLLLMGQRAERLRAVRGVR